MPATQITFVLDHKEHGALRQSALDALRKPKDQARFLLRQILQERGLLIDAVSPLPATPQLERAHE